MSFAPGRRAAAARRVAIGLGFCAIAEIGWWRHSLAFALFGVTGFLVAVAMRTWQVHCLDGVSYRRRLGVGQALFGEEVVLETELVNDKLLPLTWIKVEDEFPIGLRVSGMTPIEDDRSGRPTAVVVTAMLPFQRIRRRLVVHADRRGLHLFGPGRLTSGDPIAYRTRIRSVPERLELLVFPKILTLGPASVLPQVLLGDQRARALLGDPSRVSGVREYRPGDPLRFIDWRATARGSAMLVREHETTASLRTAVFVDLSRYQASDVSSTDLLEFTISVAASLVSAFVEEGIGVGLFGSGTAKSRPISHPPSTAPQALGAMLELLAEASPYGPRSFGEVLASELSRLSSMTSVVIVAPSFPDRVLALLESRQRRSSVSTVWVKASDDALPPMLEDIGLNVTATYHEGWHERESLDLV